MLFILDRNEKIIGTLRHDLKVEDPSVSGGVFFDDLLTEDLATGSDIFEFTTYNTLKASQNFIQLSDELAGTENRIATARKDYNDAVQKYNAKIKKFPTKMIAGMFNFDAKDYFQASEGSKEVPSVQF